MDENENNLRIIDKFRAAMTLENAQNLDIDSGKSPIQEICNKKTKYKTIYADPPWPEYGGGKIKRGADGHYPLMSIDEIKALRMMVYELSDTNAHLYLWTTNNYLPAALEVIRWWGFEYKTCITWMKDRMGLGQYYRGITEHCLFAVKGNLPYKTRTYGKRAQGITGFTEPRREHSQKPDKMRQMIELVSHAPYIELFARDKYPNWDTWGNEILTQRNNQLEQGLLASDYDNQFLETRLSKLLNTKTDGEKKEFIDQIYQEGFEDGLNDKENQ